jgi:hypothetical protein
MPTLKEKLEAALGKAITQICPNNFHDVSQNHCAHFVSHIADLTFSFNCVDFLGGSAAPANIRVHEVFTQCPQVGLFKDADQSEAQLVFVTRKNNVDLPGKKMGNIPQKHIGIFCDGMIYHYANTADKVVKWTPKKFLDTFQAIYSGDQGLYFGLFPGSDLLLAIKPTGEGIEDSLAFALNKSNGSWIAKALSGQDKKEFLVGREVNTPAKEYHGIYIPVANYYGAKYNPADYVEVIDHWAHLLDATAECESQGFMNLINTYDRAKFTFGFYQLAAHTPDDNLVLLFRELMALQRAVAYFPELKLVNGRVHRMDENGSATDLERSFDGQLQLFMNYLNPRRKLIDEQEILHAARLMHWTANDALCRGAQVRVSAEILQHKMSRRYHRWYDLHGRSDTICTIIADIHHNGRASRQTVAAALAATNKEKALLSVNDNKHQARNGRLAGKIKAMKTAGTLGAKVYDAAANEFVDK